MISRGIQNEFDFIKEINNKKLYELNLLLQDLIESLFYKVKMDTVIYCYKNVDYEKADICIKVNNTIKYVSIKMGLRNSVHCESIEKFIKFLKIKGIPKNCIDEILKYQYGDGTIDGTGEKRLSATEYKLLNQESIDNINKILNNKSLIKSVVKRFIIQGTQWHCHKIDALIYGVPNDFFFIKSNEIYKYILSKIDKQSSSVHFSCLTYQPMSRVLDYNKNMEYRRHWVQIKWYNLEDNIIELLNFRIMNKYLNN